ncbi:MAG: hypothetical protein ACPLYD_14785 [Anaerolineae bacterium]
MTMRSLFTAREWETLQFAPLWIFVMVAGADRKLEKDEVAALARELGEAHLYRNDLAREVFGSVAKAFPQVWPAFQADPRDVMVGLLDVVAALRKIDASEAEGFKRALIYLGSKIAEAGGGKGLFRKKDPKKGRAALIVACAILEVQLL